MQGQQNTDAAADIDAQVAALLQHLEDGTTGPNCTIAEHGLYRMILDRHGVEVIHNNEVAAPVMQFPPLRASHTARGGYQIGRVTGRAARAAYRAGLTAAWRSIVADQGD